MLFIAVYFDKLCFILLKVYITYKPYLNEVDFKYIF